MSPAVFFFSYFPGGVSHFCQPGLGLNLPTYSLPCVWDHRSTLPCLAYWLR
jgi:hypothetical protein